MPVFEILGFWQNVQKVNRSCTQHAAFSYERVTSVMRRRRGCASSSGGWTSCSRMTSSACATRFTSLLIRNLYIIFFRKWIYSFVLESQLPHKIVNFLFTITSWNIKLTALWDVDFLKRAVDELRAAQWRPARALQGQSQLVFNYYVLTITSRSIKPCCLLLRVYHYFEVYLTFLFTITCWLLLQGVSQLVVYYHKIVNLLFTITDQNIKLTVWKGGWLSENAS